MQKYISDFYPCTLSRRAYFSAAVRSTNGVTSGHNYTLEVFVKGPIHKDSGMILGIQELSELISTTVLKLDHKYINEDIAYFKTTPASLENLAIYCYDQIKADMSYLDDVFLDKVRLYESDDFWVEYSC